MNQDQSRTLAQIIETLSGYRVNEKKGGRFYFNLYLTQNMNEAPIEALELGVRSYNSLKRAGYSNIGELAEAISNGLELNRIKNCGKKSCREIMEKLFLYQYSALPTERREAYIREVMLLNAQKGTI